MDVVLTDFDQVAQASPGWDLNLVQRGAGPLRAHFRVFHTPRIQLGLLEYNLGYAVAGRVPQGAWSVGVIEAERGATVTSCGVELGPLDVLVSSDRRELEIAFGGATRQLILSVAEPLIASAAQRLWQQPLPDADRMSFSARHLRADYLRTGIRWMRAALANPAAQSDPRFGAAVEYDVIERLLLGCALPVSIASAPLRHAAAREVRQIILSRLGEPISLAELCAAVNVNERTLHLGFSEIYGMGPTAYARQLRLIQAQRELRRGHGVTETALKWAFSISAVFRAHTARRSATRPPRRPSSRPTIRLPQA